MNRVYCIWTGKDKIIDAVRTLCLDPGSHNHMEFCRFEAQMLADLHSAPFNDREGHRGVFGYLVFGYTTLLAPKVEAGPVRLEVDIIFPNWHKPIYINHRAHVFYPEYPADLCMVWCRKGADIHCDVAQVPKDSATGVVLLPPKDPGQTP